MRRRILFAVIALTYLCGVAFAATDPPPPDVDAATWIKAIYTAVTSKNWGLVVGLVLVALVFPLRKYGPALLKSKTGGLLLSFATSLAGTLGAALLAGAKPDLPMVITALTTAATAAGIWAWLKDHLPGAQAASDKITAEAPPKVTATRYVSILCVLVLAGSLQPACTTPAVVTAGGVAIDCLKEDQAKLVEIVGTLWSIFAGSGSWTDVEAQAIAAGKSLGGCALAEVVQKYLAPPKGRAAPPADQGRAARAALEDFRTTQVGGATFVTSMGAL